MLQNKAFSDETGGAPQGAPQAHLTPSPGAPEEHLYSAPGAPGAPGAPRNAQTGSTHTGLSLHCSLSEAEREQVQQIDREESLRDDNHPPVFFTVKFVQSNLGSDSGICRLIGEWPSMDLAREQALAGLRTSTFRRLAYICDHKGMVLEIIDRIQAEGREQG